MKFLENSGLWLSMFDDSDGTLVIETFIEIARDQVDLARLEDFIENTQGDMYLIFAPWTEEHFRKVHASPKILDDYSFLRLPDMYDLYLGYGVWCERNHITISYAEPDGTRIYSIYVESFIKEQISNSKFIDECIREGALITVLARLLVPYQDTIYTLIEDCDDVFIDYYDFLTDNETGKTEETLFRRAFTVEHTPGYSYDILETAALYGKLEMLQYFYKKNMEFSYTVLTFALLGKQFEIVEYLVDEINLIKLETSIYISLIDAQKPIPIAIPNLTMDTIRYLHERREIPMFSEDRTVSRLFTSYIIYSRVAILNFYIICLSAQLFQKKLAKSKLIIYDIMGTITIH
jgi:hypothetical protein